MERLISGDVIFLIHSESTMSRIFAWFMGSQWSHSALVAGYDPISKETFLHETSDTQTKVGMLSIYERDPRVIMKVYRRLPMLTHEKRLAMVEAGGAYHNKMYGYLRLLGAGARRLFMKLGWKKCPMLWPWGGPLCMNIPHAALKVIYPDMGEPGSVDTEELYLFCAERMALVAEKRKGKVALDYL